MSTEYINLPFLFLNAVFLICKGMGCATTKFSSSKIKHSQSFIEDLDIKIQTVLEVDDPKKRRSRKQGDARKHNRKSNRAKKPNENHQKRPKPCNNSVHQKPRSDNCITVKYSIKGLIAKGTYSRVLRVEHKVTKHPYALKVIEAPSGKELFEAELSVLGRVSHPNVIRLEEAFECENRVYMVMELATGGNLLDRLETKGCFSEDGARSVIGMVLSGVKYLHSLGITHRDLKPDNLLYYHPGKDSRILISDFGLASTRKNNGDQYMHTICGTPQYVAPEIILKKPYTAAVDLWAIGIITYIIICGAFPFDAESNSPLLKLILKGNVNMTGSCMWTGDGASITKTLRQMYIGCYKSKSAWKKFSTEAKLFVRQLLQVNPVQRLTASQALLHDWIVASRLTYSSGSSRKSYLEHHCYSQQSVQSESSRSGKSISSLRSCHRRVQLHHLEELSSDPEIAALM